MDEQQATKRAEEIIHQAVDGMSPKPILRRTGLRPVGACVADEHSAGERQQVSLSYQLTGVPGTEALQQVPMATGIPALLARNAEDESVAQLAPSTDGTLRVAVTTPAAGPRAATA
ncbi:hypothetical protein J2Z21_002219 [Streptomyces griseochromogenes]|nr:hypothetical protein [Streptomyces griseochromogenes]MBP2049288.1 hypothetical protein [Streptomyces griseochromogenes]